MGAFLLANSYVGKRIEIPDFRLVPSDAVILNQKQADDLHSVPDELEKLRKEIVLHNMRHCQQYLSKRYWY
ncbi:MAG: ATP-dependent Clp protease proteolytic subunit [Candidatus Heimdallarchaeum endolithica]|uniref:ATP-dependent Clp protease proteolytic subunit n=1 Tax=Candidatus Heimdallarchaeum endolithica TaxID=2876572 RepID=A0A9Y1BQ43_9ARCH|nr:MAG: ATP-dependent Clp protease proteolytic subunit [Candidatus Heimdallarchaeum endolithica]